MKHLCIYHALAVAFALTVHFEIFYGVCEAVLCVLKILVLTLTCVTETFIRSQNEHLLDIDDSL
jgi:hypothetical protein